MGYVDKINEISHLTVRDFYNKIEKDPDLLAKYPNIASYGKAKDALLKHARQVTADAVRGVSGKEKQNAMTWAQQRAETDFDKRTGQFHFHRKNVVPSNIGKIDPDRYLDREKQKLSKTLNVETPDKNQDLRMAMKQNAHKGSVDLQSSHSINKINRDTAYQNTDAYRRMRRETIAADRAKEHPNYLSVINKLNYVTESNINYTEGVNMSRAEKLLEKVTLLFEDLNPLYELDGGTVARAFNAAMAKAQGKYDKPADELSDKDAAADFNHRAAQVIKKYPYLATYLTGKKTVHGEAPTVRSELQDMAGEVGGRGVDFLKARRKEGERFDTTQYNYHRGLKDKPKGVKNADVVDSNIDNEIDRIENTYAIGKRGQNPTGLTGHNDITKALSHGTDRGNLAGYISKEKNLAAKRVKDAQIGNDVRSIEQADDVGRQKRRDDVKKDQDLRAALEKTKNKEKEDKIAQNYGKDITDYADDDVNESRWKTEGDGYAQMQGMVKSLTNGEVLDGTNPYATPSEIGNRVHRNLARAKAYSQDQEARLSRTPPETMKHAIAKGKALTALRKLGQTVDETNFKRSARVIDAASDAPNPDADVILRAMRQHGTGALSSVERAKKTAETPVTPNYAVLKKGIAALSKC